MDRRAPPRTAPDRRSGGSHLRRGTGLAGLNVPSEASWPMASSWAMFQSTARVACEPSLYDSSARVAAKARTAFRASSPCRPASIRWAGTDVPVLRMRPKRSIRRSASGSLMAMLLPTTAFGMPQSPDWRCGNDSADSSTSSGAPEPAAATISAVRAVRALPSSPVQETT